MQNSPYSSLFDQWQNYQKSYMDTWQSMTANAMPTIQPVNPWSTAMENWWKAASNNVQPQTNELFSMLLEQGKTFFDLSSQLNSTLVDAFNTQNSVDDFEDMVSKSFEGLKDTLSASASTAPMEFLEKMVGQGWTAGTDFVPKSIEQLQSLSEKMISMPGVGLSREKQERFQRLAIMAVDYNKATGEYLKAHNEISKQSVDLLQQRFVEMYKRNERPESCRAIYDLWVDCYEEVYAEQVMKPDYISAYGDMVNALMALTKAHREIQDDTLETLGMPSRREMDTLLQRFQQERREKSKMRAEIEMLKVQVEALTKAESPREGKVNTPAVKSRSTKAAAAMPKPDQSKAAATRRATIRKSPDNSIQIHLRKSG